MAPPPLFHPNLTKKRRRRRLATPLLHVPQRTVLDQGKTEELPTTLVTLKWKSWSLKAGWTPMSFLSGSKPIERVFEYKDVPQDKKVKLVALKLRKYASLWWENMAKKRAKRGKPKIRSWDKMKSQLKGWFLPPSYLQDIYSKLHNL